MHRRSVVRQMLIYMPQQGNRSVLFLSCVWAGEAKPVLEDELTAANRASSLKWGFTATVLAALTLFLFDPLAPVFDVRSATMLLLFVALTVTTARFVWLDRDEGLPEE